MSERAPESAKQEQGVIQGVRTSGAREMFHRVTAIRKKERSGMPRHYAQAAATGTDPLHARKRNH
jgi:hypothetical protein